MCIRDREGVCIIIADSRHFFVCHVIMGNPGIMFKNWRKREFNKDKVGMDGVMARHPGGQLQKFIIFFWKSPMYSSLEKTSSRHSSFPNSLIFSALELHFGFLLVSYFQLQSFHLNIIFVLSQNLIGLEKFYDVSTQSALSNHHSSFLL